MAMNQLKRRKEENRYWTSGQCLSCTMSPDTYSPELHLPSHFLPLSYPLPAHWLSLESHTIPFCLQALDHSSSISLFLPNYSSFRTPFQQHFLRESSSIGSNSVSYFRCIACRLYSCCNYMLVYAIIWLFSALTMTSGFRSGFVHHGAFCSEYYRCLLNICWMVYLLNKYGYYLT